jgi:hypothetical protein
MAEHDLIDGYLEELRRRLHWRDDADELVAEMEDHLRTATEDLVRDGLDRADAERAVLGRFGEPVRVARELSTTPSGGLAAPSEWSRAAGAAAMVSAGAWLGVLFSWVASTALSGSGRWELPEQLLYMAGAACLLAALGTTLMAWLGLRSRLGGLGAVGLVGRGLCTAACAAGVVAWFLPGWQGLLGAGSALVAIAAWRTGGSHRGAVATAGVAWVAGLGTWAVLRWLEVGPVDEWGDYPVAVVSGLSVGCLLAAAGLFGLGRWMHGEEPADLPASADLAPT